MKKSAQVMLSALFLASVSACKNQKEWIAGNDGNNAVQDTLINNEQYRFYKGAWYQVYSNNMIYVKRNNHRSTWLEGRKIRIGGFGGIATNGYIVHS